MIHEVDEGIRRLLAAGDVPGDRGELAFDAPTTGLDGAAQRPDGQRVPLRHPRGPDAGGSGRRRGARRRRRAARLARRWPRWFELSYLVTAWTNRPQDEHRLLSEVLACLVRSERLPNRGWLTGTLAELGLSVGAAGGGAGVGGRRGHRRVVRARRRAQTRHRPEGDLAAGRATGHPRAHR